jgi:hypothetical protein
MFIAVFTVALHWSLSWARSIQSTPSHPISLSTLILSAHLLFGLPSSLFPYGFPTNILYAFLFSPHSCYMPCPSHSPWLDRSNYVWRGVQVMKLLLMPFSPIFCHLSLFGPNILPTTLFSNTLSLCFSLNIRNQVSHLYRTTELKCLVQR